MSVHLKWTSDLNTKIKVIDEQHRKIVDYINKLQDAQEELDRKKVGSVIDDLVDYTVSHFAYEEALMEKAKYPFIEPHKKVHQLFVAKVQKYIERFEAGEDIAEELLQLLKKWLINHIKSEDADYADLVYSVQEKLHHEVKGGLIRRMVRALF